MNVSFIFSEGFVFTNDFFLIFLLYNCFKKYYICTGSECFELYEKPLETPALDVSQAKKVMFMKETTKSSLEFGSVEGCNLLCIFLPYD